jgi:hypothetical protein
LSPVTGASAPALYPANTPEARAAIVFDPEFGEHCGIRGLPSAVLSLFPEPAAAEKGIVSSKNKEIDFVWPVSRRDFLPFRA